MYHQRQPGVAGQAQLAFEVEGLRLPVRAVDEMVQATFADGQRSFAFDPLAQRVQVLRTMLGQEHRMQAVGRIQARRVGADLAQFRPAGGGGGRDQ